MVNLQQIQRSKEAKLPQYAVDKFFGNFNGLLKAMGLSPNIRESKKGITREEIIKDA